MEGYIVYERKDALYNGSYIEEYIQTGKTMGIHLTLLYYEKVSFGVRDGSPFIHYEGNPIKPVDFVIYRCRKYLLSKQFEQMGIRVFNSSTVNQIANDKAKTYQLVTQCNIPIIDTTFVENSQIVSFLEKTTESVVVKAVHGHGGTQVCLYHPKEEEKRDKKSKINEILECMGQEDVVIQPYIKGRKQDLRVYILGNKVVASVLRTATEGFKANYSLGGSVSLYELSDAEKETVSKILQKLSLDYAGIDFLIDDKGELIFNEIEDVVGARMLYQCSDINIVKEYLNYIVQSI